MQSEDVKNVKQGKLSLTAISKTKSTHEKSIDLDSPGIRKQLAKRILNDIDTYCITAYDGGHRSHLGASIIGNSCSRLSWYNFRWMKYKKLDGRMLRLFNRGHKEEARFIEWLRGIGCKVWDIAEDGEQYKIKACQGHFGGSIDGGGKLPEHYAITEPMLFEFKTQGTGYKFTELLEKGVAIVKPQHFAQMSTYGRSYQLQYAVYMAINKNDDSIHVEVVKLDWRLGAEMELKASEIIASLTPPERLSVNPTYFECKYCDYLNICHNGAEADKNCRSCSFSVPIENAEWKCNVYNATIPKEFIPSGCEQWKSLQTA